LALAGGSSVLALSTPPAEHDGGSREHYQEHGEGQPEGQPAGAIAPGKAVYRQQQVIARWQGAMS
jgi:hypothetical protein